MAINFPKKQEQRLIPKYLLDYLGEVNELHPDPSDLCGDNIEAGTGIEITGDKPKTISVDDTVAMKTDIPAGTEVIELVWTNSSRETGTLTQEDLDKIRNNKYNIIIKWKHKETGSYETYYFKDDWVGTYYFVPRVMYLDSFGGPSYWRLDIDGGDGTYSWALFDTHFNVYYYNKNQVDRLIPTKTSNLTNDSGYITNSVNNLTNYYDKTSIDGIVNDINDDIALKANSADLASVATTGSYTDLSNKPDLSIYELKADAFSGSYTDLTDKPDLSVYELKSEAFSGDYNDLSNKPTIPVVPTNVSAFTNDAGYITRSALPTNHVTTDTDQNITGIKGFTGDKRIRFFDNGSDNKMGFTCYHSAFTTNPDSYNENGYLEAKYSDKDLNNSPSIMLGMYNPTNIRKDRYLGFKYYSNNSGTTNKCNLVVPTKRTESTIRYIPVSVNGSFADNTGNISINNMVTTDTAQEITGAKVFKGSYKITCQSTRNEGASVAFKASSQSSSELPIGVMEIDERLKVMKFLVNGVVGPDYLPALGYFDSDSNYSYVAKLPKGSDKYSSISSGDVYLPLSVNNTKADSSGNISINIPTVVDIVAEGNMNAVTSNAVYDIVGDIETLLADL